MSDLDPNHTDSMYNDKRLETLSGTDVFERVFKMAMLISSCLTADPVLMPADI